METVGEICSKKSRKSIPKNLKNRIWDEYVGKEKGLGRCFVCDNEIDSKNFEAGHVVSVKKGGSDVLENLRPICSSCNKSMGTENLEEFKQKYFERKNLEKNNNIPFLEKIFVKKSDFDKLVRELEILKTKIK